MQPIRRFSSNFLAASRGFRRGLPGGLVGMIALVALVEWALSARDRDLTADISTTWRWSRMSSTRDAPKAKILCLGDSLVKFGVAPRIIEQETGLRCCNLAVYEGRPPSSYFLLRRALDAGARPAAIVVDGDMLYKDPVEYPWLWPELAGPPEIAQVAWAGRNAEFFANSMTCLLLRSFRARGEIRKSLVAGFNGTRTETLLAFEANWRNWTRNQGALIVPSSLHLAEENPRQLEQPFVRTMTWACHPINAHFNRKLLDLAASRGIAVFWLIPPKHPKFIECLDRPAWDGLFAAYLAELMGRYPNLMVVDGRHSGYDATLIGDLVHLNRRGACSFSASVGKIIRDRLADRDKARGWVNLPRFAEVADGSLEDTNQSIGHVKARWKAARK